MARRYRSWTDWPIGARVTVRRHLPEGGYSDVIGVLLATGPGGVRLVTAAGEEVEVPAERIAVGRVVGGPVTPPSDGP